jgi:hypothetical protein
MMLDFSMKEKGLSPSMATLDDELRWARAKMVTYDDGHQKWKSHGAINSGSPVPLLEENRLAAVPSIDILLCVCCRSSNDEGEGMR